MLIATRKTEDLRCGVIQSIRSKWQSFLLYPHVFTIPYRLFIGIIARLKLDARG